MTGQAPRYALGLSPLSYPILQLRKTDSGSPRGGAGILAGADTGVVAVLTARLWVLRSLV